MIKQQLHDLAKIGARQKIVDLEHELSVLQREFPDLFVSNERPVFLKAALRPESNGHDANAARRVAALKSWTPARRAKAAKRMAATRMQMTLQTARLGKPAKKKTAKKATKKKSVSGRNLKQQWYDRLKANGEERLHESAKALKAESSSLLTSSKSWLDAGVIKKTKPGHYVAGSAPPAAT